MCRAFVRDKYLGEGREAAGLGRGDIPGGMEADGSLANLRRATVGVCAHVGTKWLGLHTLVPASHWLWAVLGRACSG